MTKRTRQIFAGAFALIWLIITPLIIIYLTGYQLNVTTLELEETGSIAIFTLPKKATVELVGYDRVDTSPALFNQLEPGEYEVEVRLDGYSTWRETLTVRKRQTTEINPAILFAEASPEEILTYPKKLLPAESTSRLSDLSTTAQFELSSYSITNPYQLETTPYPTLLDETSRQLYMVRENKGISSVQEIASRVQGMQWNEAGDQLLYYTDFEIVIYLPNNNEHQVVTRQSDLIDEAIWHPRSNTVIFTSLGDITAIETRISEEPNRINLYSSSNQNGDTIDAAPQNLRTTIDGSMLFFEQSGPNTSTGLFQLPLL